MHDIEFLHHLNELVLEWSQSLGAISGFVSAIAPTLNSLVAGVVAGGLCMPFAALASKMMPNSESQA